MKLFTHQQKAIELARSRNVALFHDCGCGKSCTALNIIKEKKAAGFAPALVICPLSIIESAWLADCQRFTPELSIVSLHHDKPEVRRKRLAEHHDIYCVNYETFKNLFNEIQQKKFGAIVVDECFVGDTLVDTENGPRQISTINKGDKVCNCLGLSSVKGVKKRYFNNSILSVTTINGHRIISSANHPYFTSRGWIPANKLRKGDYVIRTADAMRMVQECHSRGTSNRTNEGVEKESETTLFLQSVLFGEMESRSTWVQRESLYKRKGRKYKQIAKKVLCFWQPCSNEADRENTSFESNEQPRVEKKMFRCLASDGTSSTCSRREREGINETSISDLQRASRENNSSTVVYRACCSYERTRGWLSNMLQNRRSGSINKTWNRGGWRVAQRGNEKGKGQEERREIVGVRVDNTEVFQSSDHIFDGYRNEQGQVVLYDLEVEGHPSFSVNGLLVHNSSKMKDYGSQTTRALLAMAGLPTKSKSGVTFKTDWIVPCRYVLSGTPAPNSEDEYFAQIKFITGPGNKVFHDNFYAFRNRYFFSIPVGGNQKIFKFKRYIDRQLPDGSFEQVNAREEFSSRIAQVAHVVRKEDAVDLPDQVHEIRHVELGKEERKAYDQMKEELVLRFADDTVLAANALTEICKLRQLTSGFCYGLEGAHQTGRSKLNELESLLEEIGDKQVIIWANFQHEIAEILKLLPKAGAIWGGGGDRETAITDFQTGKTKYLVANPASAAHGLTFVNCSYAVYFSLNYSYELQKQSEDRIHRIGQTKKCTYYHLVAKNTVDEVICKAVKSKRDMNTEILNYLRSQHGSYRKEAVGV